MFDARYCPLPFREDLQKVKYRSLGSHVSACELSWHLDSDILTFQYFSTLLQINALVIEFENEIENKQVRISISHGHGRSLEVL